MAQGREDASLRLETANELRGDELAAHELDRDALGVVLVAAFGKKHRAHAALAELLEHGVAPDDGRRLWLGYGKQRVHREEGACFADRVQHGVDGRAQARVLRADPGEEGLAVGGRQLEGPVAELEHTFRSGLVAVHSAAPESSPLDVIAR